MDQRIERLQRKAAEIPEGLSLAGGLPLAALFPRAAIVEAFRAATRDPNSPALQYGWPEGNEKLRAWVVERLRARNATADASDVIITTGAQQALGTILDVLGVEGRAIGVDAETYPGALDLFRRRGATVTASDAADVLYVMPGSSNPRGQGLSTERRAELLSSSALLIADEAYAELRFDGVTERPLLADARERVFHVGTLSKTLCPGLRLGWIVAPARFRTRLLDAKRDADLQAPSLTQAIMEQLLARFDWDAHLVRARQRYESRLDLLMRAVRRHLPQFSFVEPEGGFTLFVTTDDDLDEVQLLKAVTDFGTSFDPGSMFRADASKQPLALRLSPCNVGLREIDVAVRRLARAVELLRRGPDGALYKNKSVKSSAPGATA